MTNSKCENYFEEFSLIVSLLRFKDCGEDMLVDLSEVLFNELSFFSLMEDLRE